MAISPERAQLRARVAANKRHHPDRPELVEDDQRALKVAAAEEWIERLVNDPPSPTPEQARHLARMLYPGGADAA